MSNLLQLNLTLKRGDFSLDVHEELPLSGVTAIFGASGSGKTTLLRCIAGLEQRARGTLALGAEVWQDERGTFIPPERRRVGVVPQDAGLFPFLSVQDNLEFARRRAAKQSSPDWDSVVELTGIGDLLKRSPGELSGGERQRVALGRALLTGPRFLLMDEPLASLDVPARKSLLNRLAEMLREAQLPVLYVTHSPREVARLAERVLRLEHGGVVGRCSPAELLAELETEGEDGEFLSLLEGIVESFNEEHAITSFRVGQHLVRVPTQPSLPGEAQRLLIRSSDVTLCLQAPEGTSALNALPVEIDGLRDLGGGAVLLSCIAGDSRLLASVTRLSARELGLTVGQHCYAQFKATALD